MPLSTIITLSSDAANRTAHDAVERSGRYSFRSCSARSGMFARAPPFTGSEDFGLFLEKIPGCFAFLGTGRENEENFAPLHNPFFDYNDDMLETGAEFFAELVKERLPQ